MKNGLLAAAIVLFIFLPLSSHAAFYVPTASLTIIVNSQDQNNNYHFDLKQHNGLYWDDYEEFDLQTENFTASHFTTLVLWGSNQFRLSESVPGGWSLTDIDCTSDNPSNTFTVSQLSSSATIYAVDASNITCVFNNGPASQRNPVLIVPGVLGTNILDGQDKLWVNLGRMFTDVGDNFMDSLQFNADLSPSASGLIASDIVRREQVNTGLGKVTLFDYAYGLMEEFKSNGYVENQDLFVFPYDWRYGINQININALETKINEIRNAGKVDIIAHSTGGLLVKKYVMEHPADHYIDKAIFVGVPNTGAPKAVKVLSIGDSFGIPWLAQSEMKKIAENLPVVYDLAPSQTYFDRKGSFVRVIEQNGLSTIYRDLDYAETASFLLDDHDLNQTAYDQAQDLHTSAFDDYDLRTAGVNLYNIAGCKTGTLGKFLENRLTSETTAPTLDFIPQPVPGDGTVPLESSTNLPVDADKRFFALKADHAKMLSQNGVRQTIVNIIAGTNLSTPGMTTSINQCKLSGRAIAIYSPVEIEVLDSEGNRLLGRYEDGAIQNDIPGADFEIFGDHKFVYLPDEYVGIYTVSLKGDGAGIFTLKGLTIADDAVTTSENFVSLPVTPTLSGHLNLSGQQAILTLDLDGDGTTDQTFAPSTVLDAEESQDLAAPATSAIILGTQGQPGFYRSDVTVTLSAEDPMIEGHETETSGIFKIQYRLDEGEWQELSPSPQPSPPVGEGAVIQLPSISAEGQHFLEFYSIDRAGNREATKTVRFTIDKTPPEVVVQFDPSEKDLNFSGTDNLSSLEDIAITDAEDSIILTDQAGNTTELKLKDKSRKIILKAEIESLSYNGQLVDLSNNKLSFLWLYDKKGNLKLLTQHVQAKSGFNILATYRGKNTLLVGRDASGKILKTIKGLTLLKVSTNKGDLGWGY